MESGEVRGAHTTVPSFGTMMAAHTGGFVDAVKLDEENKIRIPATLY